jgi:hypothetical protein
MIFFLPWWFHFLIIVWEMHVFKWLAVTFGLGWITNSYLSSFFLWCTVKPVNRTLENEDILWNKNTSSGFDLLLLVQIALWKEDTFELGTPLVCPKGVLISQVSLYPSFFLCSAARPCKVWDVQLQSHGADRHQPITKQLTSQHCRLSWTTLCSRGGFHQTAG